MSFHLRDELASRMFVTAREAQRQKGEAVDERGLQKLSEDCLSDAQIFVEVICHEREHDFQLVRWLEGSGPTAQGRPSGAPRGIYECMRCGHQEERSGK